MDTLLKDLRYGIRVLRKSAGSSLLAVLTLALGIGASTAVFGVVNAILLKPLPYSEASRIVLPWRLAPVSAGFGSEQVPWDKYSFRLFRRQTKTFASFAAFQGDTFNLTTEGEPVRLDGVRASAGFFPALGVNAALGRVFTAEEDQPGHEREVVLSHALWTERFGGNSKILGQTMRLNGYVYTIIGVMPEWFSFPRAEEMPATLDFRRVPQVWVPAAIPPSAPGPEDIAVMGRLKRGVSVAQAQTELNALTKQLETQMPQSKGWFNTRVTLLTQQIIGDTRRPLLLMLGAVGIVLLIACSNVANLLLTRSIARTREFTMRSALGAGQGRLVRQLLTESLLLTVMGGLGGLLVAQTAIDLVKTFGPGNIPRLREVQIDGWVFLFATVVTVATGMLFGLAPTLGAARTNLGEALREGVQRAGGSLSGTRLRNGLLIGEVALALVLVIGTGLLVHTFYSMAGVSAGFQAEHVSTFELSLPASKYADPDAMARLYKDAIAELYHDPQVRAAGMVSYLPLAGAPDSTQIRIPQRPVTNEKDVPFANYSFISPRYFSAIGTSLLNGRYFSEGDTLATMPVTIINQAMARKYWHGENPIGKQVGVLDQTWPARTIVGVVADIKHGSLREEAVPEMFVPFTQNEIKIWPSMQTMQFAVRFNGDVNNVAAVVQRAIRSVDAELPAAKLSTMTNLVDESLAQPRFAMLLLGSFGGLAVVLACIGLYGVVSYGVAQRTREIGVRMALGAKRADVFQMILSQSGRLVGVGVLIGLLTAFGLTRLMASFLFGVAATDPLTFMAVALLLIVVAFLASVVPASRATRVDPITALRCD
jgi:predicted permease